MHFQKNYACEGIISALQGQEVFQFAKAIQWLRKNMLLFSVWVVRHNTLCVVSLIWDLCMAPLNALHVLPLAVMLCGCALWKHLVTTAVKCLTTEQWTASWSIYYCLCRFTSRIAFPPPVSNYKKMSLWLLMHIGGKKNFKGNTVSSMCLYWSQL